VTEPAIQCTDPVNATIRRLLEQPALDAHALFARYRPEIPAILRKHGLRRFVAFGSRARGDAGPTSDLDLAMEHGPRAKPLAILAAEADLEEVLGVPVDLVELPNERLQHMIARERVAHSQHSARKAYRARLVRWTMPTLPKSLALSAFLLVGLSLAPTADAACVAGQICITPGTEPEGLWSFRATGPGIDKTCWGGASADAPDDPDVTYAFVQCGTTLQTRDLTFGVSSGQPPTYEYGACSSVGSDHFGSPGAWHGSCTRLTGGEEDCVRTDINEGDRWSYSRSDVAAACESGDIWLNVPETLTVDVDETTSACVFKPTSTCAALIVTEFGCDGGPGLSVSLVVDDQTQPIACLP